jgi:fructose-bisphosphate aldolase, class II
MVRGVLEAAEEEKSPVILCHAEVHYKFTPLEKIAPILVNEASSAKVPVSILLDHGKDFGSIVRAMKLGFNAVMYDGSSLDYNENVANTREIVKIASTIGVAVEAELGHVTRPKSGGAEGNEDDAIIDNTSLYTDPEQALRFVEETGADALAVAFGTAHGVYLKTPELDWKRLARIRREVSVPLVMHGGSGLSEEDFKKSIQAGISKINYYTGMALYAAKRIKQMFPIAGDENMFYHNIMMETILAIKEDAQKTMRIFGSCGKA